MKSLPTATQKSTDLTQDKVVLDLLNGFEISGMDERDRNALVFATNRFRSGMRLHLEAAVTSGEALIEAKRVLDLNGLDFKSYVQTVFNVSVSAAYTYVKLAETYAQATDEHKSLFNAVGTITGVLFLAEQPRAVVDKIAIENNKGLTRASELVEELRAKVRANDSADVTLVQALAEGTLDAESEAKATRRQLEELQQAHDQLKIELEGERDRASRVEEFRDAAVEDKTRLQRQIDDLRAQKADERTQAKPTVRADSREAVTQKAKELEALESKIAAKKRELATVEARVEDISKFTERVDTFIEEVGATAVSNLIDNLSAAERAVVIAKITALAKHIKTLEKVVK